MAQLLGSTRGRGKRKDLREEEGLGVDLLTYEPLQGGLRQERGGGGGVRLAGISWEWNSSSAGVTWKANREGDGPGEKQSLLEELLYCDLNGKKRYLKKRLIYGAKKG